MPLVLQQDQALGVDVMFNVQRQGDGDIDAAEDGGADDVVPGDYSTPASHTHSKTS
jgi:hypothetical protein